MKTETLSENQTAHEMVYCPVSAYFDSQQTLTASDSATRTRKTNNSQAVFIGIIEEYGAMLISFTKTLLNASTEKAAEFVEDLFLDFWNNPENMSVELVHGQKLKVDLLSEVRHRAFLYFEDEIYNEAANNGFHDNQEKSESTPGSYKLMSFMPQPLRSIVHLTLSVGLSFDDVAIIEGASVTDIQKNYLKAIKLLRLSNYS